MKVRTKLLLAFIMLSCFCTTLVAFRFYSEMRPHFLEAVELTLIDTSRVLASQLAVEAKRDQKLQTETVRGAAQALISTHFPRRNAYDRPNSLRIYVTDEKGRVVFDSQNAEFEGQDFSSWRDVALTLKGQYGARATRLNPNDPGTSTHFVAAPIIVDGKIVGVISVGKTVESVNGFLQSARLRIISVFALSILAALLLSALASLWISKPLMRLENYVRSLRTEHPEAYPALQNDEIGALGLTFEALRRELEGKRFIEQYVHNLTHEIKSPLTGIIGAAEILQGDVSDVDRAKLLGNIQTEARRLEDIAQKLLELASLEARKHRLERESFDLQLLVDEVVDSFEASATLSGIQLRTEVADVAFTGERFLIWRALSNLVQNAIDFAPTGSIVRVHAKFEDDFVKVSVGDEGPGVPDFALARVTEKFFSMERPRTGKKSSGLGLSFVSEVMRLHGGRFTLENKAPGTQATLSLPQA